MRTTINGVDVVGEAEDGFRISVVILQPNLHGDATALGFHVDRFFVQHLLTAVEMLDELGDAAVVFELRMLGLTGLRIGSPLIGQRDRQSFIQKSELAQTLRQRVVVVFSRGEDTAVRQKVNFRPAPLGRARLFHFAGGLALGIGLLPGRAIAPDFQIKFFAQRVHAGDANTVQSTGNLVRRRIEFSASVQRGHHDLRGGNLFAVDVHIVDRNSAAIVDDGDAVVDVDGDFNFCGKTGQGFVDGVVDNFIHQMVQSQVARRSDVHRGTFAHGLHPAKNFDGIGVIVVLAAAIVGRDRSNLCLWFYDGSVDLFGGHSAPWSGANCHAKLQKYETSKPLLNRVRGRTIH